MAPDMENWDDDKDFQGDMSFANPLGVRSAALSSRRSASGRSESNAADEDWQVLLTPNDTNITTQAVASAMQVGIPLPRKVPQSALVGGTIKRLGYHKAPAKKPVADEWGDDFDFVGGVGSNGALKLKAGLGQEGLTTPITHPNSSSVDEDFDSEWAEGSLGIRFGGTRCDTRGRSSSVTAMSPSLGSCMSINLESEDDDTGGLVFPDEPLDLKAKLEERRHEDAEDNFENRFEPPLNVPAKRLRPGVDDNDMLFGLDLEGIDFVEHSKKRTLNRNVKFEAPRLRPSTSRMSITTLTFTEKSSNSRIPRPTNSSSKLPPVYELATTQPAQPTLQTHQPFVQRLHRPVPTTTSAQLLRQKRSAPVLGRPPTGLSNRSSAPFLPASTTTGQSHNVNACNSTHHRQVSDQDRPMSPPARSFSRMSVAEHQRATSSRSGQRRDAGMAPAHLVRMAASNSRLRVQTKKEYGKGNELDTFDDLPTSAAKEKQFTKEPKGYGSVNGRTLRRTESRSNLQMQFPERSFTMTPASSTVPSTPGVPTTPKSYFTPYQAKTPRFARDTAASRNAREQRLAVAATGSQSSLRRIDGPMVPANINWKAQVAARSPHSSPVAARKKSSRDIKKNFIPLAMAPTPKNEKGMFYNVSKQQWEGNENMVCNFPENPSTSPLPLLSSNGITNARHHHTSSIPTNFTLGARDKHGLPRHGSPPRPALISNVNQNHGPRVERGMVFDPDKMKWLKVNPHEFVDPAAPPTPGSMSIEEDDDPFAGIDDLQDECSRILPGMGGANKKISNIGDMNDNWNLGEEFDLGQRFIKRQRVEEVEWRRWTEKWFPFGVPRPEDGAGWTWEIRRVAERS